MKSLFQKLSRDLVTYNGDWTQQGYWALVIYRFGEWRYSIRFSPLRKVCSFIYKFLYKVIQILTGIELPCEAKIGDGFRIDHFGGIIVSGYSQFGNDCVIRQNVTVGLRHISEPTAPTIGDRVDIGAGARLLGDITIGNDVSIGANAVVLTDVPSNSIAVGVPARIVTKK